MASNSPDGLIRATLAVALPGLCGVAAMLAFGHGAPATGLIAVAAVLLLAGVVSWLHLSALDRTRRRLDHLAETGQDLRVKATEFGELDLSIGRLARAVRGRMEVGHAQSAIADRIVEVLPDPLLLLDKRRRVIRANRAAQDLAERDPTGDDIANGLRHPALLQAIDAVLADGEGRSSEITLPVPVERSYALRVEPLTHLRRGAAAPNAPAVIVVLHDLTQIRRGEQMRVDFVANVSHELRTPLSSLLGFIETLRGPARDDQEARDEFLRIMNDQAERMQRLIGDLLSLSRIEMDEHTRPTDPVDLAGILATVGHMLRMKAEARGMSLVLEVPERLPLVAGDADQLTQVFQNLIDNAIKYGGEGNPIEVTASEGKDPMGRPCLRIAVRDHGTGIPVQDLPRLTERFYRVDPARSRALGGTGLGLAIVKHIVNRHRGGFGVESEIDQGSVFTVTLPILEADPSRQDDAPTQP